jgi:hypothetical protein
MTRLLGAIATAVVLAVGVMSTSISISAADSDCSLKLCAQESESPGNGLPAGLNGGGGVTLYNPPVPECLDPSAGAANICRLVKCADGGGPGYWFNATPTQAGLNAGKETVRVCMTEQEAAEFGVITPAMVMREFKKLAWPQAELVIQRPDAKTLVNRPTLLYTTAGDPELQTITLLGTRVTIEATPAEFIWHANADGEGDATWSTTDPSRPWQQGEDLESLNHHVYEAAGVVGPSVDVVYAGRFRVSGGGWQDIPATLTVNGDSERLEVIEGTPVLSGDGL